MNPCPSLTITFGDCPKMTFGSLWQGEHHKDRELQLVHIEAEVDQGQALRELEHRHASLEISLFKRKIQIPQKPKNVYGWRDRREGSCEASGKVWMKFVFNATFLAFKDSQDKKQNTLALGRRKKKAVWGTDFEGDIWIACFCIAVWGANILTHNQPASKRKTCFFI